VRDTGIGMTPEAAAKVFAKYEQAEASTARKYGGTGLGLSICRELVQAFGGEIGVESVAGQGTTFTATLPLPRIGDSAAISGDADAAEAAALDEAGGGLRILAAEDHPVNQLVLRTLLSQLGCEVTLVGDGAEAVEAFRSAHWDVVLLDIQMPNMDGYEAARRIRSTERPGKHIWIVAMTANAMQGDREKCLAAGMDDYLPKPIRFEDLRDCLARKLTKPTPAQ
jgi:CheY-like chemotaxis protein